MSTGTIVFGILVPAAVFAFSFWMTDLLYKHFSKKSGASSVGKKSGD